MKLNIDCIRDIFDIVEREQVMDEKGIVKPYSGGNLFDRADLPYPIEVIQYHLKQMDDSFLLDVRTDNFLARPTQYIIKDITPQGHEFLANIRSETVWKAIKGKLSKVGSVGLPIIIKAAAELALKSFI